MEIQRNSEQLPLVRRPSAARRTTCRRRSSSRWPRPREAWRHCGCGSPMRSPGSINCAPPRAASRRIEAELAQLNRDYEVVWRFPQALVGRREQASMSEEWTRPASRAFAWIRPACVSLMKPVFPTRLGLAPLVLLASLAAGIAMSFLMAQLVPTFDNARTLRESLQRPIPGILHVAHRCLPVAPPHGNAGLREPLGPRWRFTVAGSVLSTSVARHEGTVVSSIIEQAACRLAGAQARRDRSPPGSTANDGSRGARGSEPCCPGCGSSPSRPRAPSVHELPAGCRAAAGAGSKQVQIDLARLAEMGYLTPSFPRGDGHGFPRHQAPAAEERLRKPRPTSKPGEPDHGTSSVPGEGKTFCLLNLAMSLAMDSTRRRCWSTPTSPAPRAQPTRPAAHGSDRPLLDEPVVALSSVMLRTNVDTSHPAGRPDNARATELLASEAMATCPRDRRRATPPDHRFRLAPPAGVATESRVLASHMGQVVMVVEAGYPRRRCFMQAMATIEACPGRASR